MQVRISRGLSRMALARLIPTVGPITIQRYELEGNVPNSNRMLELARALNCDIEDLCAAR